MSRRLVDREEETLEAASKAIRAVVFDLDGTIVETEQTTYEVYRKIYAEHGQELPLELWALAIGTKGGFDPYEHLQSLVGDPIDLAAIRARFDDELWSYVAESALRPGVTERLKEARRLGLRIAVASSSPHGWIEKIIGRNGIRDYFDAICGAEDVERVKPDPALFRLAAQRLGVPPGETLAVEDSYNGLIAAKGAGLHALIVPHALTEAMDFRTADIIARSLAEISFEHVIRELVRTS